jgi:murein DD-endopeptidase MepM/ murein hydrolase activator NlpD
MRYLVACVVLLLICSLQPFARVHPALAAPSLPISAAPDTTLGVQAFLETQPGPLKNYRENGQSAAAIIEGHSLYYGISPYLHLALLETVSSLLSDPNPPAEALRQPYGPGGPGGFSAHIEWASRELRAGFGPYDQAPTLSFADGEQVTITLKQSPEGVAVQRFLARGRTSTEWRQLTDRFGVVFEDYFDNQLPELVPTNPEGNALDAPTEGFLRCPWPMGVPVVHLAYFDHVYPTVDSGEDGNGTIVTYVGSADVQYNSHDGHDYVFPDNPVGTPILAAAPGIAYARTGRGNGIVIIHPGGYETIYWHLNHFAPKFRSVVDSAKGIWVEAGEILGTSGTSGFSYGTPHLHFEVRHYGRQVDPYGWYGEGTDPCERYAACANRGWLWHSDLYGFYDFTPPDQAAEDGGYQALSAPDRTPPVGTLSINPPDDLLFLAHFDGHTIQQVGKGEPVEDGAVTFDPGRYDRGLTLADTSGLTYPISGNLNLDAGTISTWAHIPETYPRSSINRHYLFAASANPEDSQRGYPGTLALRRDTSGPDGAPYWDFWSVPYESNQGEHHLRVPDTLYPGWHHLAITWDTAQGSKALYINGSRVAATRGITLPVNVGPLLQIGRFNQYGTQSGVMLDDLAIFGRVLDTSEIAAIAGATQPVLSTTTQITDTRVLLDTNARDEEGIIVAVQPGYNGTFGDPQPYHDTFTWDIPAIEGEYTLAVRYFDRASNRRVVTDTVTLDLPPQGVAHIVTSNDIGATLAISATDVQQPVEMQVSQSASFDQANWQPLRSHLFWIWRSTSEPSTSTTSPADLFVRFRDAGGQVSAPLSLRTSTRSPVYLPMVLGGE